MKARRATSFSPRSPSAAMSLRRSSLWTKYPSRAKCRPLLPPRQRRSPLGSRMQSGRAAGRTYAGVAPNARVRRRGRRSFSPHAACADGVDRRPGPRTQGASYTYIRTPKTKQQPFSVMIVDSPSRHANSPSPYGCRSIPIHGSPSPIRTQPAGTVSAAGDKACHARFARDGDLARFCRSPLARRIRQDDPDRCGARRGQLRTRPPQGTPGTCVYP